MAGGDVYGRETIEVAIGKGIYTSELASNIPDGFSAKAYNCVASGDSIENRQGFTPSSVNYRNIYSSAPDRNHHRIVHLSNSNLDNTKPAIGWCSDTSLAFIRAGSGGAGDGFMSVNLGIGTLTGMAAYGNVVYFNAPAVGVHKITGFNWSADSITYSLLAGSPGLYALISFKDRIWGFSGNRVYFTEIPTPGGVPDNWNGSGNYLTFSSSLGDTIVQWIVPIGNRLLVFTDGGLFSVTVQGAPASWIVRTLDAESRSTEGLCGFESKGIVYYTNTQGVWATNGIYVTKLSAVIEDQFFKAQGNIHTSLHPLEDGMLLSIFKLGAFQLDRDGCKMYYSKLDPVAWTEWGIQSGTGETKNSYDDYAPFNGSYRIMQVLSISKKVPTYLSSDPTYYIFVAVGNAPGTVAQDVCVQLCIYDGGTDKLYVPSGAGASTLLEEFVELTLKTKFLDGGSAYRLKQNLAGFIEIYTSDPMHNFATNWSIDASVGADRIRYNEITDFAVGEGSNLVKIPSDFMYRRCALTLTSKLQTNDSQIKIKNILIRQNTSIEEIEEIR